MFDQLVVSGEMQKTHKPWAVTLSAIVQTIILGVMILIPLIYTEALAQGHAEHLSGRARAAASASSAAADREGHQSAEDHQHSEDDRAHGDPEEHCRGEG